MSLDGQGVVLTCPAPVWWVKDADQILVVDEQKGTLVILRGLEAVIWDWLTLMYSYPRLVNLLAALRVVPADEAERQLIDVLSAWQSIGLLQRDEAAHG
jgi:hypothetical protein